MSSSENTTPEVVLSDVPEAATVEEQNDGGNEGIEPEAAEPKPAPTPEEILKKVEKNRDRLLKKYERERWEKEQLRKEIDTLKQTAQQAAPSQAKTANDFATVEEWVAYLADNAAGKKIKDIEDRFKSKDEEARTVQSTKAKQAKFQDSAQKAIASLPDFNNVMAVDVGPIPAHVMDEIYESDNPALVAYYMTKEDLFDDLVDMTPTQAARAIAKFEIQAQSLLSQTRPVSKVPAPMSSNKGTTSGGTKDLHDLDPKALLARLRKIAP